VLAVQRHGGHGVAAQAERGQLRADSLQVAQLAQLRHAVVRERELRLRHPVRRPNRARETILKYTQEMNRLTNLTSIQFYALPAAAPGTARARPATAPRCGRGTASAPACVLGLK
jgi:hypothetical protein